MPPHPRLLVSCGEASGDLYAGELLRHLRQELPALRAFGLGGHQLEGQGATLLAHVRDLAVVGLLEVLRHLQRLRRVFRHVLAEVERERPDLAVLVDYPDFNLRLASALRRRGVPVVYYVSPQVWAWRRGRIEAIRRTVSRMLVIFPFEEAIYRKAGVPVSFVGHPLVDIVRPSLDPGAFLATHGLSAERPVVVLLPGSRPQEVAHNLPPLHGALRLLVARRPDLQFAVAVAPGLRPEEVAPPLAGLPVRTIVGETHGALGVATVALVASGTATVEAALLGTPQVVVYRLSSLTYALGRPLVRVPHYAMVNLIAGREVVPELMQRRFTAQAVATETLGLLESPARMAQMKADLLEVRRLLGPPGASGRAARLVQAMLKKEKLDTIGSYM